MQHEGMCERAWKQVRQNDKDVRSARLDETGTKSMCWVEIIRLKIQPLHVIMYATKYAICATESMMPTTNRRSPRLSRLN